MFIWQEYPSLFRGIQLNETSADRHALAVRLIEVAVAQTAEPYSEHQAPRRLTRAQFRLAVGAAAFENGYRMRRELRAVLPPWTSRKQKRNCGGGYGEISGATTEDVLFRRL